MNTKTKNNLGIAINYLIAISLIISGVLKLVGFQPYKEMIIELNPNYFENIYMLGIIAIVSGVLFLIPKTFIFGFIATLVFLGGTISAHLQHGDNFIPQIVFVCLATLSVFFKKPEWFRKTITNAKQKV